MKTEEKMLEISVNALQDKLAKDLVVLHVGEATVITDYFVIATGNSKSQIDAILKDDNPQIILNLKMKIKIH